MVDFFHFHLLVNCHHFLFPLSLPPPRTGYLPPTLIKDPPNPMFVSPLFRRPFSHPQPLEILLLSPFHIFIDNGVARSFCACIYPPRNPTLRSPPPLFLVRCLGMEQQFILPPLFTFFHVYAYIPPPFIFYLYLLNKTWELFFLSYLPSRPFFSSRLPPF